LNVRGGVLTDAQPQGRVKKSSEGLETLLNRSSMLELLYDNLWYQRLGMCARTSRPGTSYRKKKNYGKKNQVHYPMI
jgi:hypothetical protein